MSQDPPGAAPVRLVSCAAAIVRDGAGALLLVRRARPPGRGLWSVPGGRVEAGESARVAAAREVLEETGLKVRVGRLLGRVHRPGPGGTCYLIDDYEASIDDGSGGVLRAGDDAAAAAWFPPAEVAELPLVDGLLAALRRWSVLPG